LCHCCSRYVVSDGGVESGLAGEPNYLLIEGLGIVKVCLLGG